MVWYLFIRFTTVLHTLGCMESEYLPLVCYFKINIFLIVSFNHFALTAVPVLKIKHVDGETFDVISNFFI